MFFVEICANNSFNFFSFCLEYFLVFFSDIILFKISLFSCSSCVSVCS